jgi:hypothetical protein
VDRGIYAVVAGAGLRDQARSQSFRRQRCFSSQLGTFNYWVPVRDVDRIIDLHGNEALFLATLVALALPFIWVGIVC